MNRALRGGLCLSVLLVVAGVAGCGGSSSNTERTQLVNKLNSQLGTSSLPRPLGTCIVQQARGLPIGQLRAVANSGSNPPASVKQLGLRLVSDCMRQGPGLTAMHQLIVQTFEKAGGSSLPSAFRTCFEQKANSTSASQLMQLLSVYASQGTSAAQAQSVQLGRQLGAECLRQPSVLNAMRTTFVAAIERELQSSHDSAAYKACLLRRMRTLSSRQLQQLVLNPANTAQLAQRIGSNASKACIASGATP
ncbi:MAG TPA: hypothetical protein VG410_00450 [Solirubrobacteraceae bacterium]|nr:hypothetical protein [Solirubrobacteraceae bacterium]